MSIIVLYRFSTITAANSIPMIGGLQPFTYTYFFAVLALNVLMTGEVSRNSVLTRVSDLFFAE